MKNVQDIYPVSPMQRSMLLHALNNPHRDSLLNQFQFEIDASLDVDSFRRSWEIIIDRHSALRTAFIWQDVKQPLQVIRNSARVEFLEQDLTGLSPADKDEAYRAYLAKDRERGFDLHRAPLMRFCIIRYSNDVWRFVWTSHHLVLDRWCLSRIYAELEEIYVGLVTGRSPEIESNNPGFRSYIDWVQRQDSNAALEYWTNALTGFEGEGQLLDRSTGAESLSAYDAAFAELTLGDETVTLLNAYVKRNALTASVVVQGAWALALNHLLRSQDVLFGITISGRPPEVPDIETIIGSFINNLPMRVRMPAEKSLLDWLTDIQAAQFARSRFEYVAVADIQRRLETEDIDIAFDSLLVWLAHVENPSGLRMRPISASFATAYPLTISVMQNQKGITVRADARHKCRRNPEEIVAIFAEALDAIVSSEPEAVLEDLALFRAGSTIDDSSGLLSRNSNRTSTVSYRESSEVAEVAAGRERLETDVLRELVRGEWARVFGTRRFADNEDFFDFGGTSLQAASVHARIESAMRQSIPMLALFRSPTIEGMTTTIFGCDWPVRTDIVTCIRASKSGAPLFCVASPEVNTVGYSLLARYLSSDMGIYVLQAPPTDNEVRQLEPSALPDVARTYVKEMRRVQPEGPYRLLGMCDGSHIAYEMARQLEADESDVQFLGMINTWALYTVTRLYHVNRIINVGRYYLSRMQQAVQMPGRRRAATCPDQFTQKANPENIQFSRADSLDHRRSPWIYDVGFASKDPKRPKLVTPASVFRLKSQPFWRVRDRCLGWSRHVRDVTVIPVPGDDHDYMLREPQITGFAAALSDCLQKLDDRANSIFHKPDRGREKTK